MTKKEWDNEFDDEKLTEEEFDKDDVEDLLANAQELDDEAENVEVDESEDPEETERLGSLLFEEQEQEDEPFEMWEHPVKENQFDKVTVNIASPDTIRSWSYGEVKNPETINYRTYKPEPGGLFCQHIFGPVKDWECACGKYKRIKYKGIICDRCGVEVAQSKVRRERMGHIELAVPVAHIWFFKTLPSRMGAILDMTVRDLEKVIYLEAYVILDPGKAKCKRGDRVTEEQLDELRLQGGPDFRAQTGAEALEELLKGINLDKEAEALSKDMAKTKSKQQRKKLAKRLKIVEGFRNSENRPEYMMIHVVPVLPPDLRPLVPLDGGRFATSDLNDLYRRVINRNNRLKLLKSQKTPDVIINNEKRMLQEAVDALIDNGRHGRTVTGPSNRPLKSLSDNLKGKQGRFRQNLLGKRVDYSGRSVIVVGPELKMTQCGLPKKMALQLFEPFVIRELKKGGFAQTIKTAKKLIEKGGNEVWDILEQVTNGHVVMLNRAPTLHRLGIQAFEPILIEGNSIRVHPLVCGGFNADFDGDQMAVHVPLSREALWEAKHFMMAPTNLFSPASGKPMMMPTQDIVLGIYYLTHAPWLKEHEKAATGLLTAAEVHRAYDNGVISLHHKIKVLFAPDWKNPGEPAPEGKKEEILETTAGRVFFNELLPAELKYYNETIDKKGLSKLINDCFKKVGAEETVATLDRIKKAGFHESTRAGISISTSDMMVPEERKAVLDKADQEVKGVNRKIAAGAITDKERYQSVVGIWTAATNEISEALYSKLQSRAEEIRELNPLHMMVDSGARGSRDQIKQLAGMRGLMANPSGEIIETPIRSNFKEGLSMLEYFISTHGARKGLADTALKTADAGYLTRRLVDVAHDIIITTDDCHTPSGIPVTAIKEGNKTLVELSKRITGRTSLYDIYRPGTNEPLVKAGELITDDKAKEIEESGIEKVIIRSVLTCEAQRGVCAKCYGMDLSKYELVKEGTPVGIIAAQSIGEPGTQLTMRTFHIGGTANAAQTISSYAADKAGIVNFENIHSVESEEGVRVLNRYGKLLIVDKSGKELSSFQLEIGTLLQVKEGDKVKKGDPLATWDPFNIPIYTEKGGQVKYKDILEGKTMEIRQTGDAQEKVILETRDELHPEIQLLDPETEEVQARYPIPVGAVLVAEEGTVVKIGDLLAKTPRKASKTRDITGGLPRVEELFEARRPKDAAEIAVIDGVISFPEKSVERGNRVVQVTSETTGETRVHKVPLTQQLIVSAGDRIRKGQQLTEGAIEPHQLLDVCGVRDLQSYLLDQVREVYQSQGVEINDKHIEVILRQMLRKVKITDPGDTDFLYDDEVERTLFETKNREVAKNGGRPSKGMPLLQGITKAGLSTSSFVSAASFQETTRVLTEAAATGREDRLMGFKENIIMGHLVPSGTGFNKDQFMGDLIGRGELDLGYTAQSEMDSAFLLDDADGENEVLGDVQELLEGGSYSASQDQEQ